jgi:site-specific recombinase
MCTFNILCVTNYQSLLKKIIEWRKTFGKESFVIDIPSLVEPAYWNINILTPNFMVYMDDTIKFMEENSEWFENIEIHKFKRVTELMRTPNINAEKIMQGRREFYAFFTENDKRLGTNLLEVFPEYTEFYNLCKEVYENYDKR